MLVFIIHILFSLIVEIFSDGCSTLGLFTNLYSSSPPCFYTCSHYVDDGFRCVISCSTDYSLSKYKYESGSVKRCFNECPTTPIHLYTDEVRMECTECNWWNQYIVNDTGNCVNNSCPDNYYLIKPAVHTDQLRICVRSCKDTGAFLFTNESSRTCETVCNSGYFIANEANEKYTCLSNSHCPINHVLLGHVCYPFSHCWEISNGLVEVVDEYKGHKICKTKCGNDEYMDENNNCKKACNATEFAIISPDNTNLCVSKCPSSLPYFNKTDRICSDRCSEYRLEITNPNDAKETCAADCSAEFPYKDVGSRTCFRNSCPPNRPYIKSKFSSYWVCDVDCGGKYIEEGSTLCIDKCPQTHKFIYADSVPYVCMESCPSYLPYYAEGNYICLSSCLGYEFYNPSTSECLTICPYDKFKFPKYEESAPTPCLDQCPDGFPYYHADKKECLSSCDIYSATNKNICLDTCPENYKLVDGKICDTKCTQAQPNYYVNEGGISICVDNCEGHGKYLVFGTFRCISNCPTQYFILGNICFIACPFGFMYFDIQSRNCYSSCEDIEDKKYHIHNSFECIKSCPSDAPYTVPGQNICYSECPPEFPFITSDYKCHTTCESSLEKYHNYGSFFCRKVCDIQGDRPFTYVNTGTCLEKCPTSMPYFRLKTREIAVSSIIIYNECISSCGNNEFLDVNGECKTSCPPHHPYYNTDRVCRDSCDNNQYYYKVDDSNTYMCVNNCGETSKPYFIYDTKECVNYCPTSRKYLSPKGICYDICIRDPTYKYSLKVSASFYVCAFGCSDILPYYNEDKICVSNCLNEKNKDIIGDNGLCVSSCLNQVNKFEVVYYQNSNIKKKICVFYCPSSELFYLEEEKKCLGNCPENYYYYTPDYKCHKSCIGTGYEFVYNNNCLKYCPRDNPNYYENEKICMPDCGNDYIIEETNVCVTKCPTNLYSYVNGTYKFCVSACKGDLPFIYQGECVDACPFPYLYYTNSEKKCLDKCPQNMIQYNPESRLCINSCYVNNIINSHLIYLLRGSCAKECDLTFPFYVTEENICLSKCPRRRPFNFEGECLAACPENASYVNYDGKCSEDCGEKKFYVREVVKISSDGNVIYGDEEEDENMGYREVFRCMDDCTIQKKFINGEFNFVTLHECLDTCPFNQKYIHTNIGKNFIECLPSCIGSPYHFLISDYICSDKCTNGKFYDPTPFPTGSDFICVDKCPLDKPYHYPNDNKCYAYCEIDVYNPYNKYKYVDLDNNECINYCSNQRYNFSALITYKDNGIQKYYRQDFCTSTCPQDRYHTTNHKCEFLCPTSQTTIPNTNFCTCEGLFYYDKENGYKTCLPFGELYCNYRNYKYRKYGTNECMNMCTGYVYRRVCYEDSCPENTRVVIRGGIKNCECSSYFYEDDKMSIADLKIICLNNSGCPPNAPYEDLTYPGRCIENCEDKRKVKFNNYCLDKCSPFMEEQLDSDGNKECICNGKWYFQEVEGNKGIVCLNSVSECPLFKPYFIIDTKECTNKCPIIYNYIYNKYCLTGCPNDNFFPSTNSELNDAGELIADYTCFCKNLWYSDWRNFGRIICGDDGAKRCKDLGEGLFPLRFYGTNQCSDTCTPPYKYKFNNYCYEHCPSWAHENNIHNICECNYRYYIQGTETVCTTDDACPNNYNKYIPEINRCDEYCPPDYPFFLQNNLCYSSCPENSVQVSTLGECNCLYLWYLDNRSEKNKDNKVCLPKDTVDCPLEFKFKIKETRECVENEGECIAKGYTKIFNGLCYKECPIYTIDVVQYCECNQNEGFWYKDENDNLHCHLIRCPEEYPYLNTENKECVKICQYYYFNFLCLKECPPYTFLLKDTNRCFRKIIELAEDLNELFSLANVNYLGIYNALKNNSLSSYSFSNFGVTLQIYGANTPRDKVQKNNLTYIDLGECKQKLINAYGLGENDDIIIVKFDITDKSDKALSNPVEYQLYDTKGFKLDVSYCQSDTINIYYDIKDSSELGFVRYDLAKEIYRQNGEDIYNYNASLYDDICIPCVINSSDVPLIERRLYLYRPIDFCEDNCSYSKVELDQFKALCKCAPKNEFIINREQNYDKNEKYYEKFGKFYEMYGYGDFRLNGKKDYILNLPLFKCYKALRDVKENKGFYVGLICLSIIFIFFILNLLFYKKKILALLFRERNKTVNYRQYLKEKNKEKIRIENEYLNNLELIHLRKNNGAPPGPASMLKNRPRPQTGNPPKKKKSFYQNNSFDDVKSWYDNPSSKRGLFDSNKNNRNKKKIKNDKTNDNMNISNNIINNSHIINSQAPIPISYPGESNIINEFTEFIPRSFSYFFFSPDESGAVKYVRREELPFIIRPKTRVLVQRIPHATYFPEFKNPLMLKENVIRVIGDGEGLNKSFSISSISISDDESNKDTYKKFYDNIMNDNRIKKRVPIRGKSGRLMRDINPSSYQKRTLDIPTRSITSTSDPYSIYSSINSNYNITPLNKNERAYTMTEKRFELDPRINRKMLDNYRKFMNENSNKIYKYKPPKEKLNIFDDLSINEDEIDDSVVRLGDWRKWNGLLDAKKDRYGFNSYKPPSNPIHAFFYCAPLEKFYHRLNYTESRKNDTRGLFSTIVSSIALRIPLLRTILFKEEYESYYVTISLYVLTNLVLFTCCAFTFIYPLLSNVFYNNGKLKFIYMTRMSFVANCISYAIIWCIERLIKFNNEYERLKKFRLYKRDIIRNGAVINFNIVEDWNYVIEVKHCLLFSTIRLIAYHILSILVSLLCLYFLSIFFYTLPASSDKLFALFLLSRAFADAVAVFIGIIFGILVYIFIRKEYPKAYKVIRTIELVM